MAGCHCVPSSSASYVLISLSWLPWILHPGGQIPVASIQWVTKQYLCIGLPILGSWFAARFYFSSGQGESQVLLFVMTMPGYKTSNLQSYLSSILHSGGGISSLLSSLTTGTNVTYTPQCRYMIKEWSMMKSWIHIRKCIGTLYLDFGTGGLYLFIRSVSDTRTWSIWRKRQPISKI